VALRVEGDLVVMGGLRKARPQMTIGIKVSLRVSTNIGTAILRGPGIRARVTLTVPLLV
jgi:hypothetical protein